MKKSNILPTYLMLWWRRSLIFFFKACAESFTQHLFCSSLLTTKQVKQEKPSILNSSQTQVSGQNNDFRIFKKLSLLQVILKDYTGHLKFICDHDWRLKEIDRWKAGGSWTLLVKRFVCETCILLPCVHVIMRHGQLQHYA